MLKMVRELAVDNPWVLRIIMGLIAVTFVVTMGWFGFEAPQADRVAVVEGQKITAKEYRTAYNRAVEFYRQNYKDKFNSDLLFCNQAIRRHDDRDGEHAAQKDELCTGA